MVKRKRAGITKKQLRSLTQKQLVDVVFKISKEHPELSGTILSILPEVCIIFFPFHKILNCFTKYEPSFDDIKKKLKSLRAAFRKARPNPRWGSKGDTYCYSKTAPSLNRYVVNASKSFARWHCYEENAEKWFDSQKTLCVDFWK